MSNPTTYRSRQLNTQGQRRQRGTKRHRQRGVAPADYWRQAAAPVEVANDQWRCVVYRADQDDYAVLDDELVQVTWQDTSTVLSGQIVWQEGAHQFYPRAQLNERKLQQARNVPTTALNPAEGYGGIYEGNMFHFHWRQAGSGPWLEVWRMRGFAPALDTSSMQVTMNLDSDLSYLQRSSDQFYYGKNKRNPNGVRLDSIVRWICERYHVTIGAMPLMSTIVKHFVVTSSPLDALRKCLTIEKNSGSGRRYFLREAGGKLYILPLQRSRNMLEIGPALIDATIQRSLPANFVTALTVRGSYRQPETLSTPAGSYHYKRRTKLALVVSSPAAIKRFGYVHADVSAPTGTSTLAAAKKFGIQQLHTRFNPQTQVNFSHPGIATLRRMDACRVRIPKEGFNMLAFASQIQHTVMPGDYEMQVTCSFTDPFIDDSLTQTKTAPKTLKGTQRSNRTTSASHGKLLG